MTPTTTATATPRDHLVVRFAGDSGDGMQLVGDQFTSTCALMGDDVATLPDYPAEIRAPAGTVAGVSGFQVCFGNRGVSTPGDRVDVLVAMNPAALKANVAALRPGATLLLNSDSFDKRSLEKAGYTANPLETGELTDYVPVPVAMQHHTQTALAQSGLSSRLADRCKNVFALGLAYRVFGRDAASTRRWLGRKFAAKAEILQANELAFAAGLAFDPGPETTLPEFRVGTRETPRRAGIYRQVTGNAAVAYGLMAAARRANLKLFLGSYPITPATDIMQVLQANRDFCNVLQAEDEIAGIGAAVGAAFGGALAATSTSGPGFSLKSEMINLAVMTELPLVIVNVQRAGPSTGLPTKTEQSDLLQALFGRHGESPIAVLAASSPRDCFDAAIEASRIALRYMTPVILLTDGYLGNGSEIWRVPDLDELPQLPTQLRQDPDGFRPYDRDPATLARPWAPVGTAGLEHRIGGLEKQDGSGTVSHDPANHEKMTELRAAKIAGIARELPPLQVSGDADAAVLVLGWGSTQGVITQAADSLRAHGYKLAALHLRHLNPLPDDLGAILARYPRILVPEMNSGQLHWLLRAAYLRAFDCLNKVQGQPFRVDEIEAKLLSILQEQA